MTVIAVNSPLFLFDAFQACGFGFLAALCYHGMVSLLPKRAKLLSWAGHLLFFSVCAMLAILFLLGRTAARQPRWFLLLGFLVGACGYYAAGAALLRAAAKVLGAVLCTLLSPFVWLFRQMVLRPWRGISAAAKNATVRLRARMRAVYNQIKPKRRKRKETDDDAQSSTKKRIAAHTKT